MQKQARHGDDGLSRTRNGQGCCRSTQGQSDGGTPRTPIKGHEGGLPLINLPYKPFHWALALGVGGLSCSPMIGAVAIGRTEVVLEVGVAGLYTHNLLINWTLNGGRIHGQQ